MDRTQYSNKQTMDKLDELEEVGYLYNKEEINVTLYNGQIVKAFVYEYVLSKFIEVEKYKEYKY